MSGIRKELDWFLGIAVGGAIALGANSAIAQITPDRTLPNNSNVTVNGSTFNITGGTQAGRNLFHSFQQFSVPTGGTAFFQNVAEIQNIFSRVTGGSVSNIDGIIKASGTANLFLINPNGIIFGKNARLNIGGSFVASTASSLKFADGFEFSATTPQSPPLLTISVPIGLQYGSNPGSIRLASQAIGDTGEPVGLQVQAEKTLALVGGDIMLDGGYLTAPNGRIELGSVAGNSLVRLTPTLTGYTLGYEDAKGFQDILLQNSAKVDNTNTNSNSDGGIQVQGANVSLTNGSSIQVVNDLGSGTGTNLSVNADIMVLNGTGIQVLTETESSATGDGGDVKINTNEFRIQDGARVLSHTFGAGKGGNISVNAAKSVQLNGTNSRLWTETESNATGNAGNVSITTGVLQFENGAQVLSDTLGAGKGGNISVNAAKSVQLNGTNSRLWAQAESNTTGNAGDISITTDVLQVQNGAQVFSDTLGAGKGGNISVNAANLVQLTGTDSTLLTQTDRNATGNAGDVNITTGVLQVQNGAQISALTLGVGKAGSINVNATDTVQLSDRSSADNQIASGLFAQTERNAAGAAGDISIKTPVLLIENGAQVSAGTLGAGNAGNINVIATKLVQLSGRSTDNQFASGLFAQAERDSTGAAGDVNINTPVLLIEKGAQVSAGTLGARRAGSININATDSVQLSGGNSGLFAQTDALNATGDAGNLSISTPTLLVQNGAQVSVNNTGTGGAGNLSITAGSARLDKGNITAQTRSGNGGNLMLNISNLLLLRNGSQISTTAGTAQRGGNGGNITINAPLIVAIPKENSHISANAFTGSGGRVDITARGIFGIESRPRPTSLSDITASSERGIGGTVQINTPDVDSSRGLVQLPTVVVNTPKLVPSGCAAFDTGGSSFTITGRGGLPPSPDEPLTNDVVWTDARSPALQQHTSKKPAVKPHSKPKAEPIAIVPATGWVFNKDKGEVTLISSAPNATSLGSNPATCPTK